MSSRCNTIIKPKFTIMLPRVIKAFKFGMGMHFGFFFLLPFSTQLTITLNGIILLPFISYWGIVGPFGLFWTLVSFDACMQGNGYDSFFCVWYNCIVRWGKGWVYHARYSPHLKLVGYNVPIGSKKGFRARIWEWKPKNGLPNDDST